MREGEVIDSGFWAAIGALVGGIIMRLILYHQRNYERKNDDVSQIRKELKERCDKLQADSDHWRSKYYADMIQLKEELFILRADNSALKIQLADMKSRGWVPEKERERYQ